MKRTVRIEFAGGRVQTLPVAAVGADGRHIIVETGPGFSAVIRKDAGLDRWTLAREPVTLTLQEAQ